MKEQNSSNSSSSSISEDNYVSVSYINKNFVNNDKLYRELTKKRIINAIIMLLKELILFLIIIISFIKYKLSLKITKQDEKDFDMDPSFFMDLIYNCFFSACYTTLALFLIEFKICKIYQLFIIIIRYLIFFITNTGQNLDGHGTYNTIMFLLCIALGQIVILIIFGITVIYKKKNQ